MKFCFATIYKMSVLQKLKCSLCSYLVSRFALFCGMETGVSTLKTFLVDLFD